MFFIILISSIFQLIQCTPCTPIPEDDPHCGYLSPLMSTMAPGTGWKSSTDVVNTFTSKLGWVCRGIPNQLAGFILCPAAVANCYGLSWGLPDDVNDIGADITLINNAKFTDLKPVYEANGISEPCYDTCRQVIEPITKCWVAQTFGVNKHANPCVGAPNSNCVENPGPK